MAGTKKHAALSDMGVKNLKFDKEKGGTVQFHADGAGLTLRITPTNKKTWQFSYRLSGRQKHMLLGNYPALSLAGARIKREELRAMVARGVDPKQAELEVGDNIFENIALKWLEHNRPRIRSSTYQVYFQRIHKHILPALGAKAIEWITKKDLVATCEQCKSSGFATPSRVASILKLIFEYAEDSGLIEINPATSLTRLFKQPRAIDGFAAQTDQKDFAENLRKIQRYCTNNKKLDIRHKLILQVLPFTGLRISALCQLKWENVDLETGKIDIQAIEGNKTKVGFSIYLGQRTLQLFKEYKELGLSDTYCFPTNGPKNPFVTRGQINRKMKAAGIDPKLQTLHGFRKCLKTLLMTINPSDKLRFLSELALGHKQENSLERTYNKSSYEQYWKSFWQYCEDLLVALRDNQTLPTWQD